MRQCRDIRTCNLLRIRRGNAAGEINENHLVTITCAREKVRKWVVRDGFQTCNLLIRREQLLEESEKIPCESLLGFRIKWIQWKLLLLNVHPLSPETECEKKMASVSDSDTYRFRRRKTAGEINENRDSHPEP
ncbi:hypothetical protein AVEN_132739-1 [Araneus ventricosus]|uniref:Uncharacterized protein n=1 Tax=Araneus ventricosus TaxID=182803 RepID=A0A4Y2PIS0_ARAVE|nr:hypothetical protein AVEN_132739-1 [Araneus ventricosus]